MRRPLSRGKQAGFLEMHRCCRCDHLVINSKTAVNCGVALVSRPSVDQNVVAIIRQSDFSAHELKDRQRV